MRPDDGGSFDSIHTMINGTPPEQISPCRMHSASLFYIRCRNHCRSSTCFILKFGVHYSRFKHHIIQIK